MANLLRGCSLALALVSLAACAGWDNGAQMIELPIVEKEALCDYAYDAWGARPAMANCDPPAANLGTEQYKLHLGQGERAEQAAVCLADANKVRWVNCKVADYVECLEAVDAAADLCASITADSCKRFADCVAAANAPD